jgi:hypothetical protein
MRIRNWFALASVFVMATGCSVAAQDNSNGTDNAIVNVPHTPVERQSIGNCWLYAEASWAESMHLTATGTEFDVSQSYWTYWHWYDQIKGGWSSEISTGGNQYTANDIIRNYGVVPEKSFVAEDSNGEMSYRQSSALNKINDELKNGRLKESSARQDAKLVRQVLDEAWQLTAEVKAWMTKAFGEDGKTTLGRTARSPEGTPIISAADFKVKYTSRASNGTVTVKDTSLAVAMDEWRTASYPTWASGGSTLESTRRSFLQRVQRALHDAQPVVITWNVDFNAMESGDNERRGSFNMTTLNGNGPGRQGGHMTVLEDYEAETVEFGLLKAGVTLDPSNAEDKKKLDAALLPTTKIKFLRVKNSWGAFRDDRSSAPGFPGYHDLYSDYLNGPIKWCPDATSPTNETCTGSSVPFRNVILPPGY